MNIVLIGYRGTGKSVIGKLLASRLGMPYIGMDAAIVARTGMSIPEIVENYGWPKFRDIESEQARELAGLDNIIIDTGGGIIERPENMEVLQMNAHIFWLKALRRMASLQAQKCREPLMTQVRRQRQLPLSSNFTPDGLIVH
jgi:shikimate kinase